MFTSLGCLAGAMVGASAWLGWVDPSSSVPPDSPSWNELLRSSRSLVTDGMSTKSSRWNSVVIAASTARSAFSPMLAAQAGNPDHHFFVDNTGRAYATPRWTRQEDIDGQRTVHIAVSRSLGESPMSLAQVRSLRALFAALDEALGKVYQGPQAPRSSLPTTLDEEWARIYGVEAGAKVNLVPTTFAAN